MKQTWHILTVSLLLLILADSAFAAESSIFTRILHDFSPVAGRVLSVQGTSVTVDCGQDSSVAPGDLFQVYGKGSPVSRGGGGNVIGYLKQPFAIVQAEKVYGRSSLCVRVSTAKRKIRSGMPVMRYSDMKAVLVMSPGMKVSKGMKQRLEDTLPALDWVDAEAFPYAVDSADAMIAAGVSLVFNIQSQGLTVYGPGYIPIHEYPLSGDSSLESGLSSSRIDGVAEPVSKTRTPDLLFQEWNSDFSSAADLSASPVAGRLFNAVRQVEVMDVNGDGSPETVYLAPRALYISPFGSKGNLFSWAVDGPGDAVGFSASQGKGWIVVNVLVKGVGLRSVLLRFSGTSLVIVEDEINLWLSFCDMDGDGSTETMLGQTFSLHKEWGDEVYRLSPSNKGIAYHDKMLLPEDFRTGWAVWGDINGNGRVDISLVDRSGRLNIFEEGILRWSSPPGLIKGNDKANMAFHALYADIFGEGSKVMVLAGSVPSGSAEGPFRKGWTAIYFIRWSGERFVIRPLTQPLKGEVAGVSQFGDTLLVAVVPEQEDDDIQAETLLYGVGLPFRANGSLVKP